MPKFEVVGADRSTGDDRTLLLDGDDAKQAEAKARKMGIMVSGIKPRQNHGGDFQAPPQLDYAAPPPPVSAQPIQPAKPPDYFAMRLMSGVFFFFAMPAYVFGLALIFGAVGNSSQPYAAVIFLGSAFGCFVAGVLMHGFSVCLLALRDIARNSFR